MNHKEPAGSGKRQSADAGNRQDVEAKRQVAEHARDVSETARTAAEFGHHSTANLYRKAGQLPQPR